MGEALRVVCAMDHLWGSVGKPLLVAHGQIPNGGYAVVSTVHVGFTALRALGAVRAGAAHSSAAQYISVFWVGLEKALSDSILQG